MRTSVRIALMLLLGASCVHGCGTPVPRGLARSLEDNLNASGDQDCASCPDTNADPPCVPLVPLCSNGQCTLGSP